MQTLILSCNTGAGHNSCAQAVQEAYHSRGEICNITDSLQFISEKASTFISNWHTRIYRHAPRLFDAGYQRAESHEDIFCEGTPIYKLLSSGAERMYQYIRSAGYDNIICTHVFPALALTEMRRQHPCLQLVTSHISTDYTCAPCTADSALDWYFIPSTSLLGEFEQCGLQPQKLIASGIPVRQQFYQRVSQEAGKANAGISPAHQHILMMCGSMGCGPMEEIISYLCPYLTTEQELSVVCGTNDDLRKKLQKRTEKYSQVHTFFVDVPAFRRMMYFVIVTYTITVLIYLFFPTCQNLRPEAFVRNNLLTRFIELFYSFDTNTNVCPSLHVIGSVAAMFGLWDCKALQSVGWKIAATSIAVCISLSTVFMKQHSIMDVLAALPVCFFGWWIAYKILPNNKTNRFLTRM